MFLGKKNAKSFKRVLSLFLEEDCIKWKLLHLCNPFVMHFSLTYRTEDFFIIGLYLYHRCRSICMAYISIFVFHK